MTAKDLSVRTQQKNASIVFSPHPDDDVISMGGTFIRLADQGHDVHVAYQTSGNTAVWEKMLYGILSLQMDFAKAMNKDVSAFEEMYKETREFLAHKKPNQVDTPEVSTVKWPN